MLCHRQRPLSGLFFLVLREAMKFYTYNCFCNIDLRLSLRFPLRKTSSVVPLLCPQSKQLIILRLYRISRIVGCHVLKILSLHMHLGICYEPDRLAMPVTMQGISYLGLLLYPTVLSENTRYISISSNYRPVHSQLRQTFPSFLPYAFYRPPAYRIRRPPLSSFREIAFLRYLSADFTELTTKAVSR